jgi:hypothetical protein
VGEEEVVEHADAVAVAEQAADEDVADVTGAADNQHLAIG